MSFSSHTSKHLGRLASIPRAPLLTGRTALEHMPNLTEDCGGAQLFVKRDDCTGLAFGGNKVRQLEFYLGAAAARSADTVLITGAVQSNFVRLAAAAACKLGMSCHIQLEERITNDDSDYRESGNVFIDRIFGATVHAYPGGEDEAGADRRLGEIAAELETAGHSPYIIPLGPGHPPLGALGYVVAAHELLGQIEAAGLRVDEIFVGSGSAATHAGLLFGLRALDSAIKVTGVCVRRDAGLQQQRVLKACDGIAALLQLESRVGINDVSLIDDFLAPGYGVAGSATMRAIVLAARREGLLLDPVYTGKVMAAVLRQATASSSRETFVFVHTGGSPALFAYREAIEEVLAGLTQN